MSPEEIAASLIDDWRPGWSQVGEAAIAEKIAEGIRLAMTSATAEVFYSDDDAILLRVSRGDAR